MRIDSIDLVAVDRVNVDGIPDENPTKTTCWAELLSVKRAEFYGAMAAGQQVDAVFDVSPIDFSDQERLVHHAPGGDVTYKIVRAYRVPAKPDSVELSCVKR